MEMAELVSTPEQLQEVVERGKHAVVLGLENGSAIEGGKRNGWRFQVSG